jgi:hypothetical protein
MKALGDEVTPISAGADIAFPARFGTLIREVIRMAAMNLGARSLATLAIAWLGLGAGCYSTTPHRVQVAAGAKPRDCSATIADVFARSGFIQLSAPKDVSMFFGARTSGPYSSFLTTGAGVGVTIDSASAAAGFCSVTIEAMSPDASCSDAHVPLACGGGAMDPVTGTRFAVSNGNASGLPPCPIVGSLACSFSNAPGDENDAAVDELARRVRVALDGEGEVN